MASVVAIVSMLGKRLSSLENAAYSTISLNHIPALHSNSCAAILCCTMVIRPNIICFFLLMLAACASPQKPATQVTRPEVPGLIKKEPLPTVPDGIGLSDARAEAKKTPWVIVDVRSAEKFKSRHLPGAISFPMSDSIDAALTDFMKQNPPATPLLVYCESDACTQAMDFAMRLINQCGYKNVSYLSGGFEAWIDDGAKPINP